MVDTCIQNVKHYWEYSLPTTLTPHSLYFIKTEQGVTMYVTDANSLPYIISGSGGGSITLTSPEGTIYIDGYAIDISQSVLNQITSVHNSLQGLQGGDTDYRGHLKLTEYNRLLALIYVNNVVTLAVNPQSGERGLATSINALYNISSGDDVFTSANINQGIGSVLANIDQGTITVSGGTKTDTAAYTLSYGYDRNGVSLSGVVNATYTAYNPQWKGISTSSTLDTANYATISGALTKVVQNTTGTNTLSIDVAPTNQYIYFISTKANAAITNNGFITDIQPWGDTTTGGFWKKSITAFLANGSTTTLYIYRTRQTRSHSSQNYTLN